MTEAGFAFPASRSRPWRIPSLGAQIGFGLAAGSFFGWAFPAAALHLEVLKEIFLNSRLAISKDEIPFRYLNSCGCEHRRSQPRPTRTIRIFTNNIEMTPYIFFL